MGERHGCLELGSSDWESYMGPAGSTKPELDYELALWQPLTIAATLPVMGGLASLLTA